VVIFPGPEPGESEPVYARPHVRMDGEYGQSTADKPPRRPVLYRKVRLEAGEVIPILYRATITGPPIY
jgi:hypothetical protein